MSIADTLGPPGPNTTGTDFNFYKQLVVTNGSFNITPDCFMGFRGSRRMLFVCTAGTVEYSFNGNTLHGAMSASLASSQLNFGPRMQDKIWFRGNGTVQVHCWQS